MSATTDSLMNDAIAAGLAYYTQQQAKKPSTIQNVPLTPSEQWQFDQQKSLFNYSPMRDYVGTYADQFINGTSNLQPSGFNFKSNIFAGDKFAGGIQAPKIDMSAVPKYWENGRPAAAGTTAAPPKTGLGTAGGGGGTGAGPNGMGHGAFNKDLGESQGGAGSALFQSPYDQAGKTPGALDLNAANTPMDGSAEALPPGMNRAQVTNVFSTLDQWAKDHPQIIKGGVAAVSAALSAAFGLPGTVAAKLFQTWMSSRSTTPPATTAPPPTTTVPSPRGTTP